MEGIDPRLRDTAPSQYEQHRRPPASFNGVTSQGGGYDASPQPNSTPSAGQNQQHQYYGMPTPGSYSASAHHDQDAGDSPYENQGPPDALDLSDLKRPRACEACRQLKVRCEPDEHSATGSCRRCAKANRQCVVTAPSRKRQKKTDSRVAELEKKIDALTATLHAQRGSELGETTLDPAIAQAQMADLQQQRSQLYHQQPWPHRSRDDPTRRELDSLPSPVGTEAPTGLKRKFRSEAEAYNETDEAGEQVIRRAPLPNQPTFPNMFQIRPPGPKEVIDRSHTDVIDRQIIDALTAYRIFDRYTTEMQFLPVVVLQPGTRAEDIRRSKPVLFLAILSAASNTIRPDLQSTFVVEIMRLLAERIICRGEKTLELVQSLQIVTVFYQPPERYEELNFNQLIHIAVVMAIDIGMGKRSRPGQVLRWNEYMGTRAPPQPNAAETRRAWLGLYFMCANASMSLRRPLLVRWSSYMEESLEVLAKAPDAVPSDKWLAHLVRSQHIAEEVGYQFSMDDPPSDISITDPKVQNHLRTFEKQLDEWRRSSTKDMPQGLFARCPLNIDANYFLDLVKHNEAILNLYIHEIAMHHSHNIDDFRPPYGVEEENEEEPDYITPAHIDSLTICLHSIHRAFDAFIAMPISTLRSLPTLYFVRNSYAAVALIKIYTAVSAKGSKFGSVFKPSDLKVDYYLDTMIDVMKRTAEGGQARMALKFTFILGMLKSWQARRAEGLMAGEDKAVLGTKSINPGWEKQAPLGQDFKSACWKGAAGKSSNTNANTKSQPSGLQMLSEVAMGNNNNSSPAIHISDPAAAAAAAALSATNPPPASSITTTNPAVKASASEWDAQLTAYAEMQPPPSLQHHQQQSQQQSSNFNSNSNSMAIEGGGNDTIFQPGSSTSGANGAGYLPEIDGFAFTAEELGALGNMMDEPGWLNFGLETGGWLG